MSTSEPFLVDSSQEHGFISYFHALPEKPATTIRIFDRNDYYTIHGSDAVFAAKEVFKTSGVIKYLGTGRQKIESVNLSKMNFESFVRDLLLVRQYRVEVYKPKGGNAKSATEWEVEYKASPGNLMQFEELLFGTTDMSNSVGVMGVKLGGDGSNRTVGIGYVDATLCRLSVCEMPDNDALGNLEAVTVQLGPKECVIPAGDLNPEYSKVKQVMERNNVLVTERKKGDFISKDYIQDLNRLLKLKKGEQENSAALPQTELVIAMAALQALIKYLELLSDEDNFHHFTMSTLDVSGFMRLDSAAIKALNVLPSAGDSGKAQNLLSLLNRCRTAQGQRLLAQWLKQPLVDRNKLMERLDVVEAFYHDSELRQALSDQHLRRLPDFQRLSRKFQRKKATLQDCYKVYQAVSKLPDLTQLIDKTSTKSRTVVRALFVTPIHDSINDFSKFIEMIDTTLDMSRVDEGDFVIKPEFDENLTDIRENIDELEKKIQRVFTLAATELQVEPNKTLKLECNAQLGYHFRITKKDEKILRGNREFKMIDANKSGVRFTSNQLKEYNDDWMAAKQNYEEQQRAVVSEIILISAGYADPMQCLSETIAALDVLVSLAVVAATSPTTYVRPKLIEKGSGAIRLKGARHPCLEVQDGVSYIPNDAQFEKHKQMFHIITGPNMGGKSTYIRSIGAIVLMAHVGSFVPCDSAEMAIVDAILARVGASDCQMKGVSTFMAEMLETSTILKSATSNSLVIIDELGRGTSTYDGFGLAWAISEYIAKEIACFTLFATHFHELTALADHIPIVNNLHVTALTTGQQLTFLYQVMPGVCDQSFGIHVAEMADFPKEVVQAARVKAEELEDYHSVSLTGTGLEGRDEMAAKRRKTEKQEGELIIADFLRKVKALPVNDLSEEELLKAIDKLKESVMSHHNFYVNDLIARGSRSTDSKP